MGDGAVMSRVKVELTPETEAVKVVVTNDEWIDRNTSCVRMRTIRKSETFASAAVVLYSLIMPAEVVSPSCALGPSTSRITIARSRRACAPLP